MAATEVVFDAKRDRLVIFASTLGTVFEWYDFFVYGTLANIVAGHFFPSDNPAVSFLIFLASFGVGFGMRPIGALLFGYAGDRLGRKYTFLVTIAMMGVATAAVGVLPTYETIGVAAPILLVACRVLQGLALGGEYGGAAIYVAEHAPRNRRGLYTSFIQAGVGAGFMLSVSVVIAANLFVDKAAFTEWGWRIPFLFSLVLLAVSLWVRLKLSESPVFQAMKEAGTTARNPLRESFGSWAKIRKLFIVMFGGAAGMTVIWYTAQFQSLYFTQNSLRIDEMPARLIAGASSMFSVVFFILFGWLSDKYGRKTLMLTGYALTILLIFPLFHIMAKAGNPDLAAAMERAPVVVTGSDCRFDPFAKVQATPCGHVLDALSKKGVAYTKLEGAAGTAPSVTIGGRIVDSSDADALDAALADAGYKLDKITPPLANCIVMMLCVLGVGILSAMTYGPVAALFVELFPARIRYTSLSVPYHIGSGYFGGFLPFISQYIVAKTGDPFAGLWYTVAICGMAFVVMLIWIPETAGKELD